MKRHLLSPTKGWRCTICALVLRACTISHHILSRMHSLLEAIWSTPSNTRSKSRERCAALVVDIGQTSAGGRTLCTGLRTHNDRGSVVQ
ncbi:hypothetical protein PF005_g7838 [Phytophthora fragariae]|uniref:Uncharacterized protein n=1 Tax=Phytophthora fragariae TaxID=53985 RepID=A0A6A4A7U1_9STRA|nr:hypothetical protein PF003_g7379 [Phytophthora fragariae]KAE8941614.1 hypothetical protein PF009_g8591 [Phytophthora fragariae]KAE9017053.1 hypothetical protein PF011_g6868 [Phytophthora fragariae]KAE9071221.1 hypothetical protein PF010_g25957 [Phytophthora fragariae]KAE9119732.1 hypothetical protein PF007_g8440 [Phytophthora fragariae]